MIKLLLLFAIAFIACNGPNDPPGDEDKAEKIEKPVITDTLKVDSLR